MSTKVIIISRDAVKGEGFTIKNQGEDGCSIVTREIPENCAVVFIDKLEWKNATRQAKV